MEYVDDLPNETADEIKQRSADNSISTDLTLLSSVILKDEYDSTSDSYDKVIEKRNELAEDAGLKKR